MKRIFGVFAYIIFPILGYLILVSNRGNSAVLERCPSAAICFASWEAKNAWARSHECQFDQGASSHDTLPPLQKDCSQKNRVDQSFLQKLEGELRLDGYVPTYTRDTRDSRGFKHNAGDVVGVSGVTISTGVDLGQQSSEGTQKIINNYINKSGNRDNVNIDALIEKLNPYFTKIKQDALAILTTKPLKITESEARLLCNPPLFNRAQK